MNRAHESSSETDGLEIGKDRAQRPLGLNPLKVVAGAGDDDEVGARVERRLARLERDALDLVPLAGLEEDLAVEPVEPAREVIVLAGPGGDGGAGERAESPVRLHVRRREVKAGPVVAELAKKHRVVGARVIVGADEALAPRVVVQPFASEVHLPNVAPDLLVERSR